MKTCSHCGAEIDEKNKFCPHCGAQCENTQEAESQVYQSSENIPESRINPYPMRWHNFQMVMMIIGSILTVINGISIMSGTEYTRQGLVASSVYSSYPGLKSCDMFYGVVVIALGVFQFIVRNRLKQFRRNGPSSLRIMYILAIGAHLIYLVWASSATSINLFNSSNLGSIASSVILMIINSVYYSKRSELFIN